MTPFYVTTPIYYVNDKPHIGHAYTSIAADVMARFMRLEGVPVKFLTGTDEHGQKVQQAAEKAGVAPQDFVDDVSERFREMSAVLNLSEDDFIRTTQPRHVQAVQALWETLVQKGQIYLGSYAGWYAVRDEAFYAESELVDGKAPTGAPVEWVEEPSYFFKLSAWQEPLLEFYAKNPDFIAPTSRRNEVLRFVEGGLQDLSLSRTTFTWGIPVPGAPDHVIYVWMDALTNYISALGYPDQTAEMTTFWPQALHVLGKDILRFHAVYWPAFLMAAGLPAPKRIFSHGWWTNEGEKISKSLGNVIDPLALVTTYGLDPVRYFLMREVPFGRDGDFSKAALIQRLNSDLANDLGNLAQRTLSLIQRHAEGKVPTPGELLPEDRAFLDDVKGALGEARIQVRDEQALHKYAEGIISRASRANRYIDAMAPWSLKKTDPARMETVLYVLAEALRLIGILGQPVMPETMGRLLDQLGISGDARNFTAFEQAPLVPEAPLPAPAPLFPRFEETAA